MTGIGALFGSAITADTTVNVDNSPTLGSITFDNEHKYTLSSDNGSNLTLDTFDPAGAQVTVLSGSHEIDVPVNINPALTTVTVGPLSSTLTFTGTLNFSNGTATLVKAGAGVMAVPSLTVPNLNLNAGTLKITSPRASANTSVIQGYSVTPGATFDLGNNDLIINYNNNGTPDPAQLTKVMGQIATGYANGAWTGTGFTELGRRHDRGNKLEPPQDRGWATPKPARSAWAATTASAWIMTISSSPTPGRAMPISTARSTYSTSTLCPAGTTSPARGIRVISTTTARSTPRTSPCWPPTTDRPALQARLCRGSWARSCPNRRRFP